MNKIIKAGCILIDKNNNKVALCYRDNYNDYSFPKGHVENNESLIECAIRETEEEIKRVPIIENENEYYKVNYDSKEGNITVYYFISYDGGKSNNESLDTHELVWVDIKDVYKSLTYESDKNMWNNYLRKGE